jgi:magnesium chelatase family protein
MTELMESDEKHESSETIRRRVIKARDRQSVRYSGFAGVHGNAGMPEREMESFCALDPFAKKFLLGKIDQMRLSARSYSRILKVSRTIADLAGSETIELPHVAEAVHFRCWDKMVR